MTATATHVTMAEPLPPLPVTIGCPVRCLGLSQHAYRPLIRAVGVNIDPPKTVGDVLELARRERLNKISGIGPTRITEIENALRAAGFDLHHDHRQPDAQPPPP